MSFLPSQDFKDARLVGGLAALINADPINPAYANLLDGTGTPLVTMVFARPAVTFVDHALLFAQGDIAGDMIPTQGSAATFNLYNGAGTFLGVGDVSNEAGSGAMKISGTTGTLLYAGARAILAELKVV